MTRGPTRLRHWKQRFDPTARFVFRRATAWGGEAFKPGDIVPDSLAQNTRRLRIMWDARRIALYKFPSVDVATGQTVLSDVEQIARAIREMDTSDLSLYTSSGLPRVDALEAAVGKPITAAQRTEALELIAAEA